MSSGKQRDYNRFPKSNKDQRRYHKIERGLKKHKRLKVGLEYKREEKPIPLNGKCSPLCPLFLCTQRALIIAAKTVGEGMKQRKAICRLTGSECISAECQYAACRINSLLPDGKCAKAIKIRHRPASDEELFREIQSIEDYEIEEFTK